MPLASIPSPSQGVWYLGIIPIRAYALCIVLGVIVAVWLSERRWRARGGQKGTIIDIAVPAVIFGLIGGRLYHVITDWQTYFGSRAIKPAYKALFIWEGGLGIWGAIALGGVGVWLAARRRGLSMTALADTIAPGIAFAQGIGRWGNWFNQELYGSPTTLPWGLEIDVDHGGEPGVLYHPTFLYESIWDILLGFALLLVGRRLNLRYGRLFALYVAGYTFARFWIEGLRIDPVGGVDHAVTFLGLRINQWTSIVLFVGALIYFWATRNKEGVEVVVSPSADADPEHGADQSDPGSTDDTLASDASTSGASASGASSSDASTSGASASGASASDASASDVSTSGGSASGAPASDTLASDVPAVDGGSGASGEDRSAMDGDPAHSGAGLADAREAAGDDRDTGSAIGSGSGDAAVGAVTGDSREGAEEAEKEPGSRAGKETNTR
ncbi:prolipoprotein diacylglyceryl transferase [Nonomuraea bangladeshensis]|uniref:Phosphatidylglycerol--prolipoprotein diacylglyceryl transferase n=1 Tax=Nonomuraea bangladeshensis TaxID=404385 RepID=A0ABV3GXQ2_9ACTN